MSKRSGKLLYEGSEWDYPKLKRTYDAIEEIAVTELKLTTYPSQIEIISSDQMLDCYSSTGLPVMYNHWSFGKHFLQDEYSYRKGYSSLAYELVLNTSPTIAYFMEENSMTMQALVTAHSLFGHGTFFKNNYLFKQWTDAEAIVDYLVFAKKFLHQCEEKYGVKEVEEILDSAHALKSHGIDRYQRPGKLSKEMEVTRQQERMAIVQKEASEFWSTVVPDKSDQVKPAAKFPKEPEENLLYFFEKYSPKLVDWQREVVRIVRLLAQYLYPQGQTKVENEGCATFVHYYIMNRLWETGQINDGSYLEFIHSHTGVVFQPGFDDRRFSGFNPYHLGFGIFTDLRRICENPTSEDKDWFPDIAGTPWLDTFHNAIENFRDESFISQFLSPKLMRDNRMFMLHDVSENPGYNVSRIHNERGYRQIRAALSRQYQVGRYEPEIQVVDANLRGDRTLHLLHNSYDGVRLNKVTPDVLRHIYNLWGHKVVLDSRDATTGEHGGSLDFDG